MVFGVNVYTFLFFLSMRYVLVNLLEVDVQIPENVAVGGSATLGCIFNCKIDEIYSVKWYRGNREFYRYMPSEDPAIKVFPFTFGGIEVDVRNSHASCVTLRNVSKLLSGQFTCEVTAGENFTTVTAYSDLYIYDSETFNKPIIRYDETEHRVLCSTSKVYHPMERISTVFYSDNDKIDQKNTTYDHPNNVIILDTHLLDWNNIKSKTIHCEVNLPGTTPISSDEILIENYTSSAVTAMPSVMIISIWWILNN